jgi:hypothetical protein
VLHLVVLAYSALEALAGRHPQLPTLLPAPQATPHLAVAVAVDRSMDLTPVPVVTAATACAVFTLGNS